MKNDAIQLKAHLTSEDCDRIDRLQQLCFKSGDTSLKLELEYKFKAAKADVSPVSAVNEWLYYSEGELIGYIGLCSFGGSKPEINGMVHPDYRRRGLFSLMDGLVRFELGRRGIGEALFLCDRRSEAGQRFIQRSGGVLDHTEYEMYLSKNADTAGTEESAVGCGGDKSQLFFKKADNGDREEIGRQNAIYFGGDYDPAQTILPEEEEQRGMTVYLAYRNDEVIGKIHLQMTQKTGGIYGLGVLPQHRGQGLGRRILMEGIRRLQAAGAEDVMLQVEARNDNALNLYRSCGFESTSVMDYYTIKMV